MEHHLAVAEGDAIAGVERDGIGDLDAVEHRAVDAPAVAHVPGSFVVNDLRMAARKETILDRNRAVGRPPQRDGLAGSGNLLRGDARLVDGKPHSLSQFGLHVFPGGRHDYTYGDGYCDPVSAGSAAKIAM